MPKEFIDLFVNGGFTIIGALIGFLGTFWVYHLQEKSKEKDKIIYYYSVLNDSSIRLRPFEVGEVKSLIYKKTKDKKYLSDDFLSNGKIKEILEKFI
ncbi:MAG: hypothetical protein AB7E37_00095 [Candidatus Altimarinota bacterium]